jgi:hypothetical protein
MTDIQALKTELTTDPVSMPYLPLTAENDAANADIINNADGTYPRTATNENVDSDDIRGSTTFDAFDGLVLATQAWFEWLTGSGQVPVNDETIQKLAGIPVTNDSIWAAADRDEMNPAMAALMQFEGSRAQEISDVLETSTITASDVADARQLP